MFRKFWKSRNGNFAIMTAVLTIPLLLGVGMAVDYSRYVSAQRHLQEVADSVSLALVTTPPKNKKAMAAQAQTYVNANISKARIDKVNDIKETDLTVGTDDVDVALSGQIQTSFMGLAGYNILDVRASSLAKRAINGSVEVALVLDNTFSMSETDSDGVSKLDSLKNAANTLVTELNKNAKADVRIGLVPYADYINVGTQYRKEKWLSIPVDYTVPAVAKSGCVINKVTVQGSCQRREPNYDCSVYVDGVLKPRTCTGACTAYGPDREVEKETCKVNASAKREYKWYGCIGSRTIGKTRLNDDSPNVPYPGYVETSQKCLSPIVPLTNSKSTITSSIDGMVYKLGSYEPYTYIPAGMIWGVNLLSPGAPFSEGEAYDPQNKKPRKALVLMTDGDNTLKFRPSDGRHVAFNSNGNAGNVEFRKVNEETIDICDYAKSNEIEVFTVAFMVDNNDAKTMLQQCATDSQHYFDASDPAALMAAFSGIAQSLSVVRLAR